MIGRIGAAAVVFIASLCAMPQAWAEARPTRIALQPYLRVVWSFEADLGGKRRTFLFDTGGGITVITRVVAADIGCASWGAAHRAPDARRQGRHGAL